MSLPSKKTCSQQLERSILIRILFEHQREATLSGITIPKGTQVIPLLNAVYMNPNLWIDPERFNPERFLSDDQRNHLDHHHLTT